MLLLGTGTEAGMPETRVIFLMNFIIVLALKKVFSRSMDSNTISDFQGWRQG